MRQQWCQYEVPEAVAKTAAVAMVARWLRAVAALATVQSARVGVAQSAT